ncbi:MAG: SDR family oxidoreductase [Flavobacteriaceae bacterium]|nr:SDR family oxidoreductase [Flavobacteriaceae bacterium]
MSKIVIVTGASSGIGNSIATLLCKYNFTVYGTCRNPKDYKNSFDFQLLSLDISNEKSIHLFINKIKNKHKKIDVLINNAGQGITGAVEETSINKLRENFETNFFGPLKLIQLILPIMRKNNFGKIINITSIGGYMGLPYRGGYSSSKGAFSLISESLRMEVKKFNIEVSTIAPGDFKTDIASRRYHTPLNKGSIYSKEYEKSLELMNLDVYKGKDPILVAYKVINIINNKNPKVHYVLGSFLEKLSIFLKFILPQKIFEKLIMIHYKL